MFVCCGCVPQFDTNHLVVNRLSLSGVISLTKGYMSARVEVLRQGAEHIDRLLASTQAGVNDVKL